MSMTMIDLEKRIAMALEKDAKSFSDFNLWQEAIQYAPPIELLELISDIQASADSLLLFEQYDLFVSQYIHHKRIKQSSV